MCFAPQRRALFRHLNFQKRSENGVFCTFWLRNVLRATTACTFSTSQCPKTGPNVKFFWTFSLAFFRHLNFQNWSEHEFFFELFHLQMCFTPQRRALFDISTAKSGPDLVCFCTFWLRNMLRATMACNFSSLIWPAGSAPAAFRPSGDTNHWRNTVFRDFPTFFAHLDLLSSQTFSFVIFFLLLFSSLPISAFHLSILSEVWLLNFLR